MRLKLSITLLLLSSLPWSVADSKQSPIKILDPREASMWSPYIEWTLENPSFDGNPFDVVARVRFTHEQSEAMHTTEMFFTGEESWRFRFTGDREGEWTFTTSSADPELNGYSGSVIVRANPNPDAAGFLTHVGNRFALQHDDADDLRAHLFNVYMNGHITGNDFKRFSEPESLNALLDDTQANGFDTTFIYLCHNWLNLGTLRHDEHQSVNPDLATFEILDNMIVQAQARGMRWHLWAWGDESRKWTPHGLPGGINGRVDRRLQRYIAARLGPLPGWTMGYGFDLIEWTSDKGRNGWAEYLHEKMGWDHLLCTRGYALHSAQNNITAYSGFGGRDLSTTRGGPADYNEVVSHMEADATRPSFYEERHSYLREGFNLDMDGTRRLRWWQAMAGGLGGFYGFYSSSPTPYPHPEQLRTAQRFWKGRFALDLKRANDLTDGCALKTPDMARLIFYKEDTNTIKADLSNLPQRARVLAVDTCKSYREIDLGIFDAREHTISLPYQSDWAVAVGTFDLALSRHASVQNGWLVHEGKAVLGWVQHNGWWRDGQRPNLTRRAVNDPKGDIRPNRTEDLDALTDNMLKYAYPGFEHNYGLWFDRRRDTHDTIRRDNPRVKPPFLEQPWARSTVGTAWDGLPKYDLETFNPWYFARLKTFADLCDNKGTFLIHKVHMQHALLETQTHYVDFPWRPANCIQNTGLPDTIPAANAFYDIAHPERRRLHRLYIRKCLDELGDHRNVIHLPGEEFTGPLSFTRFWLDTVVAWEHETGKNVNLGVGAPKDVLDALLEDPLTEPHIDTIDLRYWWTRSDGTLFAPPGGTEVPGRGLESGSRQSSETTLELIYKKVRTYRDRYPDKVIIDALHADRKAWWAFFMAGGSLLVRGQLEYPGSGDPDAYGPPVGIDEILLSYEFLRQNMAEHVPRMRPIDLTHDNGSPLWCLADPGRVYMAYLPQGGEAAFNGNEVSGAFRAQWFNPRSGELLTATQNPTAQDLQLRFVAPDEQDWVLILKARSTQ